MAKVRSGGGKRWVDRASMSSEEYGQGIQNPRVPWAQATVNAADNQALGVQQAIADKRFEKGVAAAGDSKWRDKALSKGKGRFIQGVQVSQSDYEKGVKPYTDAIEATTLPTRYPAGDPRNLERVAALNRSLRARKMGG